MNILGVMVSAINLDDALAMFDQWIRDRSRHYVCVTGVHGLIESWRDPALRHIHNHAGAVTPDGMPLVWMSRLLGFPNVSRVYGPDLMRAATALSARAGYRNFYFGSRPETLSRLCDSLVQTYPGLTVAGNLSPPYREVTADEDEAMVQAINAARPDLIWVGLGTPKQERWMASHIHRLDAPVIVGVGAAFDFLSGEKKQAPVWIQRSGFEWLFRLVCEPRRLASRYLRNNPVFLFLAIQQLLMPWRYEQPNAAATGETTV